MHPLPRRFPPLAGVLFLLLALWAAGLAVASAQTEIRQRIEAIRGELGEIEKVVDADDASDQVLVGQRGKVEPLLDELRGIVSEQQPRLEGVKARLEQLGPKPDASKGQTESADVGRERTEQETLLRDLDGLLALGRAQIVKGEQIISKIVDKRRRILTRTLMQQSRSVLSPMLWLDVLNAAPGEWRSTRFLLQQQMDHASSRLEFARLLPLGIGLGLFLLLLFPGRRVARRFAARTPATEPTRLAKAVAALRVTAIWAVIPVVVAFGFLNLLDLLDLLTDRIEPVIRSIVLGLAFTAFAYGIAQGVLAPNAPNWRLPAISDDSAHRLMRLAFVFTLVIVLGKALEALNQAIYAVLPVTVATKGTFAALAALAAAYTLRGIGTRRAGETAENGAAPATAMQSGVPMRLVAWSLVLTVLLAAVSGYVSLASFLTDQITWIATIGVILYLLLTLLDEMIGSGLTSRGVIGRQMAAQTGLTETSLKQVSVLLSGFTRLVLVVIAGMMILAPWGLDSGDMLGTFRAALFGFTVGGVTISISTILTAIALFAVGFALTRAVQRWLDRSYLPLTSMDIGLRNSITTILGYAGIVLAASMALSSLGFSLDRLTIVAGALSVGIGFGLQSIINNFVSGLILLWERPIRVGDWIVVGDEQGIVKHINVRSTQIETFDRCSLIVPNAEFISGRVKNWTHADRLARVIIPVGVGYGSGPEDVKTILIEVAKAHPKVLRDPPPRVFFMKLGDASLDFELRCFTDVDQTLVTKSELLFEIFRRLREARIDIPMPKRPASLLAQDEPQQDAGGTAARLDAPDGSAAKARNP
jgi:small-conductance mechanosensitive channel